MSTFSAKSIPVSLMRLIAVTLMLLLSTFTLGVPTAQAAGTVTDCTSFGYAPGTLGFALFGGGGTITFACSGTIVVPANGLDLISGPDLVFDATGYNVTLSGNSANRVLYVHNQNVTLRHLTIANGKAGVGGGVWVQSGSLTVEHSTFTGNTATGGGGGAYLQSGSLTVEHSTFTGNSATTEGGAILSGGTLTIANSVITSNSAMGDGGGVHTGVNSNNTTINDSTISGNTAGERGGGIALDSGFATISRSTISGNSAQAGSRPEGGGGVFVANYMTARIFNSTISGNTSAKTGGGLVTEYNANTTLINSTVTANHANTSGGGIRRVDDGTGAKITLDNTIVAGNTASVDGLDMSGAIVSGNYNLIGSTVGATFAPQANDITGQNALLGPLADNGGGTFTHALLPGSPAIDAGNTTMDTDQRGIARPQGAADDIGAYEVQAGTITIVKDAVGGDDAFEFGSTVNSDFVIPPFTLTTQGGAAQQTLSDLAPGFYEIAEVVPQGWKLSNLSCDAAHGWDENKVRLNLAAGENVTCTFTNTKLGSLTIVKKTSGGDGTFSYSSPQLGPFRLTTQKKTAQRTFAGVAPGVYSVSEAPTRGWDLTAVSCSDGSNPASINVAPGEDVTCNFTNVQRGSLTVVKNSTGGDATFPFVSTTLGAFDVTTVGGTAQRAFANLVTGTYDLSENVPAGWVQSGATCSDGSNPASVNVAPGESVTCTFTNAKQGSITVVKQATGADTTFPFASTALGAFDLTTVNGAAQRAFANLTPGVYDLSENLLSGWQQTRASCSDGSTLPNVEVAVGEDVTCTFANAQLDTILIVKLAIGGDAAFPFTSTALGSFVLTTTDGLAVQAFSGLAAGTYDVAEGATAGWTPAEADPQCSNGNNASSITLGAGETVVCIFANLKQDTIVVEKRTVGGDGSFGFSSNLPGAASFTLATVNGVASRAFDNLPPATYSVSENPAPGWVQTGVSCDNGATPDTINLTPGATVRCIFTDTKLSSITVVKQAVGGNGSFAFTGSLGAFNLATAGGTAQRTFANLLPGSYRISETVPSGWRLTDAGCANGSSPASITLTPGEAVICTFANTRAGSLTVVVNATDGNGAFGFTSQALGSFAITTTAGAGQQAFVNLTPGTFDLTEDPAPGWDLGLATCSNGSNPASVTVGAGEAVTCIFENTEAMTKVYMPFIGKQ
jgi:predicted outer membrane repeat protein